MLRWARKNGCPWTEYAAACAAQNGHLETLQWMRANGCPWDERVCAYAAEVRVHAAASGGCRRLTKKKNQYAQVDVLEWARENGCPWDSDACMFAAQEGNLSTLQWLRAKGCPWDERVCAAALPSAGTWRCCAGPARTAAVGTS